MTPSEIEQLKKKLPHFSPEARLNCNTFLKLRSDLKVVAQIESTEDDDKVLPLHETKEQFIEEVREGLLELLNLLSANKAIRKVAGFTDLELARLRQAKWYTTDTRDKFMDFVERYLKKMAEKA